MKLYYTLGIYCLTLLMTAHSFMVPIVFISFKLQQDYIAKNLCENRDTPITTCYGTCVLKKELKETAEKEKKQTNNHQNRVEIVFCQAFASLMPSPYRPVTNQPFFEDYTHFLGSSHISEFFIPPRG